MGALDPIHEAAETLAARGPGRLSPFFVHMMLADTPAATISIAYGLSGPNLAVYTACASGNNAIGEAAAIIRRDATGRGGRAGRRLVCGRAADGG